MRVNKNIQLVVSASAILGASICMSSPALAEEQSVGLWDKFTNNVSTTWDSDKYELYIPFFTWHNRFMYDKEKTNTYNEEPWGFGIGKYRYDEDNDWHALHCTQWHLWILIIKSNRLSDMVSKKCGSPVIWMASVWGLVSR